MMFQSPGVATKVMQAQTPSIVGYNEISVKTRWILYSSMIRPCRPCMAKINTSHNSLTT